MNSSPHFLTDAGALLARRFALVLVGAFVVLWLIFDHGTFDWHGVLTAVTLFMTLFIQRSEHRDMQATQAKLDELLRAHGEAPLRFVKPRRQGARGSRSLQSTAMSFDVKAALMFREALLAELSEEAGPRSYGRRSFGLAF